MMEWKHYLTRYGIGLKFYPFDWGLYFHCSKTSEQMTIQIGPFWFDIYWGD